MVISFFEGAHNIERTDEQCEECDANLLKVDFKKVCTGIINTSTWSQYGYYEYNYFFECFYQC